MMANNQNRGSSFSSSTVSSLAKRQASDGNTKPNASASLLHMAKKRAPLSNITNQKKGPRISDTNSIEKTKKASAPVCVRVDFSSSGLPQNKFRFVPSGDEAVSIASSIQTNTSMDISSPRKSDEVSVSMDESMDDEVSVVESVERTALSNLHIAENEEAKGNYCSREILSVIESGHDTALNFGTSPMDRQACVTFACDIYKHLRASEAKKRPSPGFLERVQKDVNASMRGILIDWLVEVSEEYRLVPDTLHLTVNYIDRYLSGNLISRQKLQLLGVACMMIAAKHEEICAPQVEEFCYITDNTYFKEEVLEMGSCVLKYLNFEMKAPTAKCFLRRFIRAAQGIGEVPTVQLECMANYITELSLLNYSMLSYAPSLVAASAIFLAKYILDPSKRPWNSTLQHYTLYQPSDLRVCVKDLHSLCNNSHTSTALPAIRDKYNQHKYKFVAKKFCPPVIPSEFFNN